MRKLACLTAVALLAGCAGTEMTARGQACGQPFDLTLTDRKDRASFEARVECPGGGGLTVTSSDSSTSAVIAAQAELAGQFKDVINTLAGKIP